MHGTQLSETCGEACDRCGSKRRGTFNGEIALHFTGLNGLSKPIVWIFPKVAVCFDCGRAEFQVPEGELRILETGHE